MKHSVTLTVAEGKRLIAKGVLAHPAVKAKLKQGLVCLAKGGTNGYLYEELTGQLDARLAYCSGVLKPQKNAEYSGLVREPLKDLVLRDGKAVETLDRFTAPAQMQVGDIYIKGANALDYKNQLAGILIAGENGGTIGAVAGHLHTKKIHLIIPVGLEKRVLEDLATLSRLTFAEDATSPRLWITGGTIITEIEALHLLCGVTTHLIAAGGIAGAEGCLHLLLEGDAQQIDAAKTLLGSLQGEPRYVP